MGLKRPKLTERQLRAAKYALVAALEHSWEGLITKQDLKGALRKLNDMESYRIAKKHLYRPPVSQ